MAMTRKQPVMEESNQAAPRLVAFGASLGGLRILQLLLARLPAECTTTFVIVQHRVADASRLAHLLQTHSKLPLCEPDDKQPVAEGWVYLAPADYHLLISEGCFSLSIDAPVCYARPSIDVLFESVARAYRAESAVMVLTGASRDGAEGALAVHRRGGKVVVQAPETAESAVAPAAALALVPTAPSLPPERLADLLEGWVRPAASPPRAKMSSAQG